MRFSRPRRITKRYVVLWAASAGGGEIKVISEGAQSSTVMTAIVIVPASIAEGAQSGDTDTSYDQLTTQMAAAGESSELMVAIATAAAAITDGAQSGADWVAVLTALGDITEGAQSADVWQQVNDDLANQSLNAGAESLEQFLAAVSAIASITGAATSGEALQVTATAIAYLSAGAQSADSWAGVDLGVLSIVKSITAAVQSSVTFINAGDVPVGFSAGAISSAIFAAPGYGAVGALVISAITLTAHLTADITLEQMLAKTDINLE